MAFPLKTCVACGEEFELRPNHAGYANRCVQCNSPEESGDAGVATASFEDKRAADAARREAIKEMLYSRK